MLDNELKEENIIVKDEILYNKTSIALRQYFPQTYDYLRFEIIPRISKKGKLDGSYSINLPTPKLFEKAYGKFQLEFCVQHDVLIIEQIKPSDILIKCFKNTPSLYKGIPYFTEKEYFKLQLFDKYE